MRADTIKTMETKYYLQPGDRLGDRYEIVSVLGQGGFATVYEARQLNIDRRVAVKVLEARPRMGQEEVFKERFLREARVAAQIEHPNVVTIYDYNIISDNGQPYIVMEFLDGHDLEQEILRGPMPASRLIPLFINALDALAAGHRTGVVHKDLKPSNLFLKWPGQRRESLCVLDFGIARTAETQGKQLTKTGDMVGTPHYMAPEYINAQIATPALDVYQMGLILVEALTGRPLVDEQTPMLCLVRHSLGNLEYPKPLINSPLGPVLLKALAHDHQKRFPHAGAFLDSLAAIDLSAIPTITPAVTSGAIPPLTTGDLPRPTTDQLEQRPLVRTLVEGDLSGKSPLRDLEQRPLAKTVVERSSLTPAKPISSPPPPSVVPTVHLSVATLPSPSANGESSKASRGAVVGIAVGVVSLLVGATLIVSALGSNDHPAAERTAPPIENFGGSESPAPTAPAPTSPPTPAAAAAASTTTVELLTVPAGALVSQGEQQLGATPLSVELPSDDAKPIRLSISLPGFTPLVREVRASDAPSLTLTLAPVPSPVASSQQPEPTRKPPPKPAAQRPQAAPRPAPTAPPSTPVADKQPTPQRSKPAARPPVKPTTPLPIID